MRIFKMYSGIFAAGPEFSLQAELLNLLITPNLAKLSLGIRKNSGRAYKPESSSTFVFSISCVESTKVHCH